MLSVSFSLALVAEMLFGIVLPGRHKEVDEFNGQTREPFLTGPHDLVTDLRQFKSPREHFCDMATACEKHAGASHTQRRKLIVVLGCFRAFAASISKVRSGLGAALVGRGREQMAGLEAKHS